MAKPAAESEKIIATNPDAFRDYAISETVEAGLVLTGTEVKSLRAKGATIKDAFVDIDQRSFEAFLLNVHIAPYSHGNIWNHEPERKRKLLLHRHQIERMFGAITRDGMTIVPTKMYFKAGRAKIELGVAKGKKKGDRRQDVKRKESDREIDQAMKKGNRR
jgi:SsrA-binding protein